MNGERYEFLPAERVAEINERREIKESYGCAACEFRSMEAFPGCWTCAQNQAPWKNKPYCGHWSIDEDAEVLK